MQLRRLRAPLFPVPEVESFEQLNAMVDAWDASDDARRIGSRAHTVGEQPSAAGRA